MLARIWPPRARAIASGSADSSRTSVVTSLVESLDSGPCIQGAAPIADSIGRIFQLPRTRDRGVTRREQRRVQDLERLAGADLVLEDDRDAAAQLAVVDEALAGGARDGGDDRADLRIAEVQHQPAPPDAARRI
jgi:hypothetical protein